MSLIKVRGCQLLMQRTFVVGCPRSGTTLVQAMLARHPGIFTLPETGFFPRMLGELDYRMGDDGARPRRRTMARRLGLTRRYGRHEFVALQQMLLGNARASSRSPWLLDRCVERFIAMLDSLATEAGRSSWVEKTPQHLVYMPEIEHYVPGARFIHVIRPGMDVLASIVDAELRYDNEAFTGGLTRWMRRWNRAVELHRSCLGLPNHHFIFLGDLVKDPIEEWQRLCAFLKLPLHAELDHSCHQHIADLKTEPWKQGALSGLPRPSDSKADKLFGPQLREWLQSRLSSYEELYAMNKHARQQYGVSSSATETSTLREAPAGTPARDAAPRERRFRTA